MFPGGQGDAAGAVGSQEPGEGTKQHGDMAAGRSVGGAVDTQRIRGSGAGRNSRQGHEAR